MVLCQVYTTSAAANTYAINVFGTKKVKIARIDYNYSGAGSGDLMIELRSSILRMPYGNNPYFVFCNNPNSQVGNIHSDLEFYADFKGNLDLEIVDKSNGLAPAGFSKFCLTLDIQNAE